MSIRSATSVQAACIPPILAGRDCIGSAQTGSGKTIAFAIPILQELSKDPYGIFAVVLTPTRELAFQIHDQFVALGTAINLKCSVIVGGLDMMQQAADLSGRPHVIVATPGRLWDLIKSSSQGQWSLSKVKFLVLDEADRLLCDLQNSRNKRQLASFDVVCICLAVDPAGRLEARKYVTEYSNEIAADKPIVHIPKIPDVDTPPVLRTLPMVNMQPLLVRRAQAGETVSLGSSIVRIKCVILVRKPAVNQPPASITMNICQARIASSGQGIDARKAIINLHEYMQDLREMGSLGNYRPFPCEIDCQRLLDGGGAYRIHRFAKPLLLETLHQSRLTAQRASHDIPSTSGRGMNAADSPAPGSTSTDKSGSRVISVQPPIAIARPSARQRAARQASMARAYQITDPRGPGYVIGLKLELLRIGNRTSLHWTQLTAPSTLQVQSIQNNAEMTKMLCKRMLRENTAIGETSFRCIQRGGKLQIVALAPGVGITRLKKINEQAD